MVAHADKPILHFDTVGDWEQWLEVHVSETGGIRLRLRKKVSNQPGITYAEALDIALCHGWIDGQISSLDENYFLQAFTPRRAQSPWSKINRDHVARLSTEGRMRAEGQAEVDRAKGDGRWEAAYQQKGSTVPEDFQNALDGNTTALATFTGLTSQGRFAFVFRLGNIKRPETRQRKIAEYVALLERGESLK